MRRRSTIPISRTWITPINFNVGKIEGGDWASTVAAWCKLHCRIAIYPGNDPADRAKQIEEYLASDLGNDSFLGNRPPQVTWNGFFACGYGPGRKHRCGKGTCRGAPACHRQHSGELRDARLSRCPCLCDLCRHALPRLWTDYGKHSRLRRTGQPVFDQARYRSDCLVYRRLVRTGTGRQ